MVTVTPNAKKALTEMVLKHGTADLALRIVKTGFG
jgi:hypothetical protein